MTFQLATASDVLRFYGERPPQTLRAIIIVQDGEPVGIIGLASENGFGKMFSEYKPFLKGKLRCMMILRAIKLAMSFAERCPMPVVAIAQPDEPHSPQLLERLGFEFYQPSDEGDVYLWRS